MLEVTLTSGANVRLVDSTNLNLYKNGKAHKYFGGLAKQSPVRIPIPSSGRWHAIVDMQGLKGSTRASFRVINGSALKPLPPVREQRLELSQIVENAVEAFHQRPTDVAEYDVFISHASEDKQDVVEPLVRALGERGVTVWYDDSVLKVGDSLRRKIDEGIAHSRFGLVVLSRAFFKKGWPSYELDGLVTLSVSGKQVLLPIWHDISKDEVMSQSPSLADRVALRTSDYSIAEIADQLADVIG